ncbi:hypothetical protein [Nonomuraea salmonea]|uniref:hypothetical protein n=1 Tax=Nonomuraea salmonea TaxID=46181 RepID=UPI002FE882DC
MITGTSSTRYHACRTASSVPSVAAAIEIATPRLITRPSEIVANVRRGGLPWSRPRSIIAAYAHTAPGMYFPSCPTNMIRPATRTGTRVPSPARISRQATSMKNWPSSTEPKAPSTAQGDMRASAPVVSSQLAASP